MQKSQWSGTFIIQKGPPTGNGCPNSNVSNFRWWECGVSTLSFCVISEWFTGGAPKCPSVQKKCLQKYWLLLSLSMDTANCSHTKEMAQQMTRNSEVLSFGTAKLRVFTSSHRHVEAKIWKRFYSTNYFNAWRYEKSRRTIIRSNQRN